MRPHPKIRKTVKWGGAAASVLLAVVWVASVWWVAGYESIRGFGIQVGSGCFYVYSPTNRTNNAVPPDWYSARRDPVLFGRFLWIHGGDTTMLYTPLWAFFVPLVSVTAAACWLDRRTRRWVLLGACTKCGYDRAGIAAGAVCPECGAAASSQK